MSAARLLLVDADEDDRHQVAEQLRGRGFDVTEAGDSVDGMQRLSAEHPDLVLCDVSTARNGDDSMLRRLFDDAPDVPVIVVAGAAGQSALMEALRLGAADYLTKPVVDVDALVHAVEKVLERARLLRENRRYKDELEAANKQLRDYLEALQQDQRAGRKVQMGMLPPSPMAIEGIRLQHRIIPSLYLSGDFVDYFRITDRHFIFYIADVSGHGASSAFVTVLLKNFSRRLRREYRPRMLSEPGDVLRWLNQELLESHLDRHVTMFVGVVDCDNERLAFANAGHFPAPLLVSAGEGRFLEQPGKPLGLFPDLRFESGSVELPEDFVLALFSDGVLEVLEAPDLPSRERMLARAVEEHGADMDGLCAALGLKSDMEAPDDVACLLISRTD